MNDSNKGVVFIFYLTLVLESVRPDFEKNLAALNLQNILFSPDTIETLSDITSMNNTQLRKAIQLEIQSETNQFFAGGQLSILIISISFGIVGLILTVFGVTRNTLSSIT